MNKVIVALSSIILSAHGQLLGEVPSLIGGEMGLSIEITEPIVEITMSGPSDTWFGVGFGNTIMDGTYSIIATANANGTYSVEEWILGNHQRGDLTPIQALTIVSDTIDGDLTRTVIVERSITGPNYTFPSQSALVDIIVSDGQNGVLEYATASRMGAFESALLTLGTPAPTMEPTLEPTTPRPTKPDDTPFPTVSPTAPTLSPTTSPTDGVSTLPPNVMLYATSILNLVNDQSISFYLDDTSQHIAIVLTGPADVYYAVGFGNNMMDGTYTIVVDGFGGVTERILGSHSPGIMLQSSLIVMVNEVKDGIRTVAVLRDINMHHEDYYNFLPFVQSCNNGIPLIYAYGFSPSFGFHEQWGNGVTIYGECSTMSPDQDPEMPSTANYVIPTICIYILSVFYTLFT